MIGAMPYFRWNNIPLFHRFMTITIILDYWQYMYMSLATLLRVKLRPCTLSPLISKYLELSNRSGENKYITACSGQTFQFFSIDNYIEGWHHPENKEIKWTMSTFSVNFITSKILLRQITTSSYFAFILEWVVCVIGF